MISSAKSENQKGQEKRKRTNTPFNRTEKILAENPSLKDKWVGGTPQQRMGDPEDLMGPVTFLLSDASRYVTGADLRVDGGYTIV